MTMTSEQKNPLTDVILFTDKEKESMGEWMKNRQMWHRKLAEKAQPWLDDAVSMASAYQVVITTYMDGSADIAIKDTTTDDIDDEQFLALSNDDIDDHDYYILHVRKSKRPLPRIVSLHGAELHRLNQFIKVTEFAINDTNDCRDMPVLDIPPSKIIRYIFTITPTSIGDMMSIEDRITGYSRTISANL